MVVAVETFALFLATGTATAPSLPRIKRAQLATTPNAAMGAVARQEGRSRGAVGF